MTRIPACWGQVNSRDTCCNGIVVCKAEPVQAGVIDVTPTSMSSPAAAMLCLRVNQGKDADATSCRWQVSQTPSTHSCYIELQLTSCHELGKGKDKVRQLLDSEANLRKDAGAKGSPEGKRGSRYPHDCVGKLPSHSISQALHWGSSGLGCLHQPQDVCYGCCIATAQSSDLHFDLIRFAGQRFTTVKCA